MDNFPVPRLWTEDFSLICGEAPLSSPYSNSAGSTERSTRAWNSPMEALDSPLRGPGNAKSAWRGPWWSAPGAPEKRFGRSPGSRRQPFLMRLVSSVTWL